MGHNSVVLSYPKSIGIPWVDGLSMGPPGFRVSHIQSPIMRSGRLGIKTRFLGII